MHNYKIDKKNIRFIWCFFQWLSVGVSMGVNGDGSFWHTHWHKNERGAIKNGSPQCRPSNITGILYCLTSACNSQISENMIQRFSIIDTEYNFFITFHIAMAVIKKKSRDVWSRYTDAVEFWQHSYKIKLIHLFLQTK